MRKKGHFYHDGQSTLANPTIQNMGQTNRLRGKVVLVLGGESENGRSLITALAQKGADLVLVFAYSLPAGALALKERIEELGQRCLIITGDPSSKGFAQQAMRQIGMTFGRLDVFIDYSVQNEEDGHPIFPNFAMMIAALAEMSED